MRFFIPLATSDEQAERVLAATAKFTGFPIPSPRIYSVSYTHNGEEMVATVGKEADPYYRAVGPVIAILATDTCFSVCTRDRGVARGDPIYVGRGPGMEVEYFEED